MVSVIITTCKRPPALVTRALRSVMNQTYQDIEIIVVDDSPSNYSGRARVREAVYSLCPSVLYITHNENLGACAARNTGVKAAKGKYIAFLDDDDEWLPKKIEAQLLGFTNEGIAFVYCGFIVRDEVNHIEYISETEYKSGKVYARLLESNFIGSTSIPLFRRESIEAIGLFDNNMKSYQDMDIYLRLAKQYEVNYVTGEYVVYHVHEGQRISNTLLSKIDGTKRLIEKFSADMDNNAWIHQHRVLIELYSEKGEKKEALSLWLSTVRRMPQDVIGNIKYLVLAIFSSDFLPFRIYHNTKKKSRLYHYRRID